MARTQRSPHFKRHLRKLILEKAEGGLSSDGLKTLIRSIKKEYGVNVHPNAVRRLLSSGKPSNHRPGMARMSPSVHGR